MPLHVFKAEWDVPLSPLFDTKRWTRDFEIAARMLWDVWTSTGAIYPIAINTLPAPPRHTWSSHQTLSRDAPQHGKTQDISPGSGRRVI